MVPLMASWYLDWLGVFRAQLRHMPLIGDGLSLELAVVRTPQLEHPEMKLAFSNWFRFGDDAACCQQRLVRILHLSSPSAVCKTTTTYIQVHTRAGTAVLSPCPAGPHTPSHSIIAVPFGFSIAFVRNAHDPNKRGSSSAMTYKVIH